MTHTETLEMVKELRETAERFIHSTYHKKFHAAADRLELLAKEVEVMRGEIIDSRNDEVAIHDICHAIIPNFVDGDSNGVPTMVDCVQATIKHVQKLWEDAVTYQETELRPKLADANARISSDAIAKQLLKEALEQIASRQFSTKYLAEEHAYAAIAQQQKEKSL